MSPLSDAIIQLHIATATAAIVIATAAVVIATATVVIATATISVIVEQKDDDNEDNKKIVV